MNRHPTYTVRDLLSGWLRRQVAPAAWEWLAEAVARVADGAERDLFLTIGLVARRLGKDDLVLTPADRADAERLRPGWNPTGWSVDQAGRLVLVLAAEAPEHLAHRLDRLAATADVGELVALHRGLPLYPDPPRHLRRAGEGVRSNMTAVFRAVAHDNPYPAEAFPEPMWNQMVLKALFVGAALHPIRGLERRANPALTRMLCDYARERRAAGRPVSPELWRCVAPHADDGALAHLEQALASRDSRERAGAALALWTCPHRDSDRLLSRAPALRNAAEAGQIDWARLAFPV